MSASIAKSKSKLVILLVIKNIYQQK